MQSFYFALIFNVSFHNTSSNSMNEKKEKQKQKGIIFA